MKAYLPDLIIYFEFHINQLRGFDSVCGRISPFPIGMPPLTRGDNRYSLDMNKKNNKQVK